MDTQHLDTVIEKHTQDMTGRIAAVTGTTSGTGYICARELAKRGATVLLLNRQSARAKSSLESLQEAVPNATFVAITCDLQDFDSVRAAITKIKTDYERLDVLCNNAGVMAMPDSATKDGYEVQMQTNCISHFLLTKDLFPLLRNSDDARIVNHSSMARNGDPLEAQYFAQDDTAWGGDGTPDEAMQFSGPRWKRYQQTKLANCAFTYGLVEKLNENKITNVKSIVAHPGLASTQLQVTTSEAGGMAKDSPFMEQAQTAEDGALGIIRGCMDPDAKSGDFFGPVGLTGFPDLIPPEPLLTDRHNIDTNWDGCEAAVGAFEFQ